MLLYAAAVNRYVGLSRGGGVLGPDDAGGLAGDRKRVQGIRCDGLIVQKVSGLKAGGRGADIALDGQGAGSRGVRKKHITGDAVHGVVPGSRSRGRRGSGRGGNRVEQGKGAVADRRSIVGIGRYRDTEHQKQRETDFQKVLHLCSSSFMVFPALKSARVSPLAY